MNRRSNLVSAAGTFVSAHGSGASDCVAVVDRAGLNYYVSEFSQITNTYAGLARLSSTTLYGLSLPTSIYSSMNGAFDPENPS